jgi:hypothetical protein
MEKLQIILAPNKIFDVTPILNEKLHRSEFEIVFQNYKIATLILNLEDMKWQDLDLKLDENLVIKLGEKIESYFE